MIDEERDPFMPQRLEAYLSQHRREQTVPDDVRSRVVICQQTEEVGNARMRVDGFALNPGMNQGKQLIMVGRLMRRCSVDELKQGIVFR